MTSWRRRAMLRARMAAAGEKARALRLERLAAMLEKGLENPAAALDVLVAELKKGEPQELLWEKLHAAAARDGKEQELKAAYAIVTSDRRLAQLAPPEQAEVLLHGADFQQGILGDRAASEALLFRVQRVVPGQQEAFERLERRFEAAADTRGLIELYAIAATAERADASSLVSKIVNKIVPLPAAQPLSEEACKRVVALAPTHPILFDVVDAHCKKGKRFELTCALFEQALGDPALTKSAAAPVRRRLIELYIVDADTPAGALPHIEALLAEDPTEELARGAAERLLSNRDVAARAAAALQEARRQQRWSDRLHQMRGESDE
jgi:hypothetical protein